MNQLLAKVNIGEMPLGGGNTLESTFPTLATLVNSLLQNVFIIVGTIFLGLLIFGGLQLIIGAGSNDAKKTDTGKQAITNAVIGLLVVFAAFFIIQIIEAVTGVSILNNST
ncbi:MAG: hypothetical protein ACOX6N_04220 [Patescibacteria group bacterium]|jgi:hypothetical protein